MLEDEMRPIHWIVLGPHPNWKECGRAILQDNPIADVKKMTLLDIAEFFLRRRQCAPQGGKSPYKPIDAEDWSEISGASN